MVHVTTEYTYLSAPPQPVRHSSDGLLDVVKGRRAP